MSYITSHFAYLHDVELEAMGVRYAKIEILGDFWGIWDIEPEMDDDKGTSLVLLHSEKGKKEFDSLSKRIQSKKVTLKQASECNSSLLFSSPTKLEREVVLQAILSDDMELAIDIIQIAQLKGGFWRKILHKIKSVLV